MQPVAEAIAASLPPLQYALRQETDAGEPIHLAVPPVASPWIEVQRVT
jgi:hypothetical protein